MIPTLYDGNGGAKAAFTVAQTLLKRARPEAVQIHAWEFERTADSVRLILPNAKIITGFGVDSVAREVAKGRMSVGKGVSTLFGLAERASGAGVTAVVFNAEAAWKRPPNSEEAKRLTDCVRGALGQIHGRYPSLLLWHTAYGRPGVHSTYNWWDWLGDGSPILASLPQVYAAPDGNVIASVGALPSREAADQLSWAKVAKAKWVKPDAPAGTPEDEGDCDWLPYYQLHHVPTRDTVACATRHPLTFGWALPTRADGAGAGAFLAVNALLRLGYTGKDAVRDFQHDFGLTIDNICGPLTLLKLMELIDALNAEGKQLARG